MHNLVARLVQTEFKGFRVQVYIKSVLSSLLILLLLHIHCVPICSWAYNFKQFENIWEAGVYYYTLVSPQTKQTLPPSSPSDLELKCSPSLEVSICFTNTITELITVLTQFYRYTTTRIKDTDIYIRGTASRPRFLTGLTSFGVFKE
jgi:hypothetical protein